MEKRIEVGEVLQGRMAVGLAQPGESGAQLQAGSVVEFMVMPAGTHEGHFGQAGRSVARTVIVNRETAVALEEQLEAVNAATRQRAFFDFDHQDSGPASGWPLAYVWRQSPAPGVYVRAELSQAGADAIRGRTYRAFSPVFYVTPKPDPARIICRPDAALNFGGFVNEPAFREIAPLWAREPHAKDAKGAKEQDFPGARVPGAAGARSSDDKEIKPMQEQEMAALQAKVTKLEQENGALKASAGQSEELKAPEAELAKMRGELDKANGAIQARRRKDAEDAVAAAVKRGAIPAKDGALKARWQKLIEDDPENVVLLAAEPDSPVLAAGGITRAATVEAGRAGASALQAKEGPARVIQAFGALAARNSGVRDLSFSGFKEKGAHAREMAALYARDIAPRWHEFRDMPLTAAEVSDQNLGTLSGTLVAQRTLELFRLVFPAINRIYTDFSDSPAQFRQTESTRVLVVPAVQTYSTDADATGRPQGWKTVSAAQTKEVSITLDEHVGVPIVFDANTLASTLRRLFDEQAPAAAYALAKYFVEKIYKLFTLANFNAYAQKNGTKVPVAYPKYPVALGDFARSTLTRLAAIFNPNEVPIDNRVVLLTSGYFEQLATDPSLVTFFAGQQAPEIVTANRLPKLAGFEPIEAPNLPVAGTAPDLVGMALHKSAVVAKTRLSNDYTQALPGSSYGSVTTITDPDIGISVVLVQYVNHTGGYAEWRIQVMLGAAVGDNRGGLCITSQ